MDYTKVPRELIWADRTNIDDFFVDDSGTMDNIMFERIGRSMICNLPDAAEYVIDIYNNAYYITTLILMEKHPILYFSSYIDISMSAGGGNNTFKRYFSCMTMAMVYNYLRASDSEYCKEKNILMERIIRYHNECYSFGMSDDKARSLFFDNVLSLDEIKKHRINELFIPRSIFQVVCYVDAGIIQIQPGFDYVINTICDIRKTEYAIQCFDYLIDNFCHAKILDKDSVIKKVKNIKKEFCCIREEPPIRKGKHGNLIEQPENMDAQEDTGCSSREDELESMVRELQEEKQTAEASLSEYMERNQNRRGINGHLVALLGLKLAPKLGITFSNKKQLAPVLSDLFGWGKRKLEQELSSYFSDEDDLALAQIFADLSPELAKDICPKWEGTPTSDTEAPLIE